MMNIYIAASYGRRKEMLKHANELEAVGHRVTSRWLRGKFEHEDEAFDDGDNAARLRIGQPHALKDIEDIYKADVLVLFPCVGQSPSSRGGRHFEMGFAYGLRMQCHVIGHRENVFCTLPDVRFHESWQDFLVWLGNQNGDGEE
jgi:hypothetical protein